MRNSDRILVAGGGIGGLAVALCLARRGWEVLVLEKTAAFAETGAGIQISPNASRVLHHLGLACALQPMACEPEAVEFRHWRSGKLAAAIPLGKAALAAYGFPYYHVHRGDLRALLLQAAERDPRIALRAGAEVRRVAQAPGRVHVAAHADGGTVWHEGSALIGADGIHSTVRTALFGAQTPKFAGQVAWRALVPSKRLPKSLARPAATVWWGAGRHFVCYGVRAGALLNCVCVVEKAGWQAESWTERGAPEELAGDFAGWHADVRTLIAQMDGHALYKWAIHRRPPARRWGAGAVTLLGDAAHPMPPFMAQGAAMAIEDAAVLAACLSGGGDVATGLKRYQSARRARTAMVQRLSHRNARLFHLPGLAAWARDRLTARLAPKVMARVFNYDAVRSSPG